MTRAVAVLRPDPGNGATVERVRAAGLAAIPLPLFDVVPIPWAPPGTDAFDRLLLTSANAVRHGGAGLSSLRALPVLAVGGATAAAARAAGFVLDTVGPGDLAGLLDGIAPHQRLLWLSGEDRTTTTHPAIARVVPVYRAVARELMRAQAESLAGSVVLLHSARAGMQLAAEVDRHKIARAGIRMAAISAKAATAAGSGWARITIATAPDDHSLIAAARGLAIDP